MNNDNIIDDFYIDLRSGSCPLYGGGQSIAFPDEDKIREDAKNSDILYCYFIFLCERVGLNNGVNHISQGDPSLTFFNLASTLHSIKFRGGVPNDINRVNDGKQLRVWFAKVGSNFKDYSVLDKPSASVLEVLVALAERIDNDIMCSEEDNPRISEWFWVMMNNMHITKEDYNDKKWCLELKNFVEYRINLMLERNYKADGDGSLFPMNLHFSPNNWGISPNIQNFWDVEIWYQMQFWFKKHYFS